MKITQEQLDIIAPNISLSSAELNKLFTKYKVNTANRIAGFLSQCACTSVDFTSREVNLNYSLNGLKRVFRDIFPTDKSAKPYSRNPERIANRIYANRYGNADEASGDGWKYRGRGYLLLTGKTNYIEFAKQIGLDLDSTIDYCETNKGAVESALYVWKRDNFNELCDDDNIAAITKAIDGDVFGIDNKKAHYEKAKEVLD